MTEMRFLLSLALAVTLIPCLSAAQDGKFSRKRKGENKKKKGERHVPQTREFGDGSRKPRKSKARPEGTTEAALKGLDWLAANGTVIEVGRGKTKYTYALQGQVSSAALAGLAALASGDEKYEELFESCYQTVTGGLEGVLTGEPQPGGQRDQQNWGLSFGGLFLAEARAYRPSQELDSMLQKIADQLVINMDETGGYGHDASGPCSSGYIFIEVMSNFALPCLAVLKREGFTVPNSALKKGAAYIEMCTSKKGVAYSHRKKAYHVSRSGGAVFALGLTERGEAFAQARKILDEKMSQVQNAHSTTALGFFQCALGSLQVDSRLWDKYIETWFPGFLGVQNPDGSFGVLRNPRENLGIEEMLGPSYTTALYCLILMLDQGGLRHLSGKR